MAQGPLCYSKGNLLYEQWREGSQPHLLPPVLLWGPIGEEKEVTDKTIFAGLTAPIRCSSDQKFLYKYPNRMVALLEEYGMVEIQYSGKGQEGHLWLHSPNSTNPVLIQGYTPKDAQSLSNNVHSFQEWKGAYFITTTGETHQAWWLFPNGATERIQIPNGPWDKIRNPRHVGFKVTRAGLLIVAGCAFRQSCNWYLLRGDMLATIPHFQKPEKLDIGLSFHNVISPDGCTLATTRGATGLGMKIPPKIKVIDLCSHKTP